MEILGDSHSSGKDPKDQAEQQITGVTSYQFYVVVKKKSTKCLLRKESSHNA